MPPRSMIGRHADVAELGAEQERGEALQKKQKSAGGKQLIDRRRAENGRNDQHVHEDAEHGNEDDPRREGERQRPAELDVEPINGVHAAHDEVGVGDPHHVDHAEDQVQPERKQRQHAAQQDAVDHRFEEIDIHLAYSPM